MKSKPIAFICLLLAFAAGGCSSGGETRSIAEFGAEDFPSDTLEPAVAVASPKPERRVKPEQSPADNPDPGVSGRIAVNNIGPLGELFNDSNKYQYVHAERLGIEPITDLRSAYRTRRPLRHITSCDLYEVDTLTHSMPFLVPEAGRLLEDIGRNFKDSLKSRGRKGYRIRVTSLLRTASTVKKLRRVNVNATDSSTHKFGTTFDLSYTRFHREGNSTTLHDGDLKNLLAEVLNDLRSQGRCLVKFERKTGCFHVTVVK